MNKKLNLTILILAITVSIGYSQTKTNTVVQATAPVKNNDAVFQLFQTQNMWTFIKLNTRTGQMWQVQYNTEDDKRFETNLNSISLVPKEKEQNGRFNLYATQNIYSFILLDQIDGKTWQVQWSSKPENRLVLPIE
ncbi:MAG: hypothetical protein EOO44_09040 [Flavobacterium sp.]|nr:MAG: hypothetical protein EOO44_09040 [Flavobacterium sp.]